MTGQKEVREKLEASKPECTGSRVGQVEKIAALVSEALALLDGEQGKRIEGFARELGTNNVFGKRLFRFHTHQTSPKAIPYEGPMDAAILILDTPTESEAAS